MLEGHLVAHERRIWPRTAWCSAEGMVVVLRGAIDLYRPKGEIGFILSELDVTALLGRLAAQRAQLLGKLEAEGLLRRNAGLPVPEVPLRVGLVASPGTEGYQDFLGQLTGSGFGFQRAGRAGSRAGW